MRHDSRFRLCIVRCGISKKELSVGPCRRRLRLPEVRHSLVIELVKTKPLVVVRLGLWNDLVIGIEKVLRETAEHVHDAEPDKMMSPVSNSDFVLEAL